MWVQKVPGGGIDGLAYSPDGATLYARDRGGWVTAWDVAARAGRKFVSDRRLSPWARLGVTPDGRRLFAVMNPVTVWDVPERRLLTHGGARLLAWNPTCCLPDGRMFGPHYNETAIGGWNLATDEPEPDRRVPDTRTPLRCLDLSPDERRAVVIDWGGGATVYEWGAGPELRAVAGLPDDRWIPAAARFAPDGKTLAVAPEAPLVSLLDATTLEVRASRVPCWLDHRVAFNPVLPVFAAVGFDGALTLFHLGTGAPVRALDFALGRFVTCAVFAPDGLTCAVGGSNRQFAVFDVDL